MTHTCELKITRLRLRWGIGEPCGGTESLREQPEPALPLGLWGSALGAQLALAGLLMELKCC